MDKNIKISIITVTYNAERTLEETILSVIHQSFKNIEYLIIDGESKDRTCSIINKYKDWISYFVSEPDRGIYDAMNKGIKKATGDFVIFLGADDHFISNDVLSRVVQCISDENCVYYGDIYRPMRNDIYCGYFNKYKLAVKNIPHQALFYPKLVYKNYEYSITYKIYADYYLNIEIYRTIKFKYLGFIVSFFGESGISSVTPKDHSFLQIRKKHILSNLGILPYYYSRLYHIIRNLIKHEN